MDTSTQEVYLTKLSFGKSAKQQNTIMERATTAKMAREVADTIFPALGWNRRDCEDLDFDCVFPKNHKGKAHKHPVDNVFSYISPIERDEVYVISDLKSYGGKTLSDASKFDAALLSLGQTIECAGSSEPWRKKFASGAAPKIIRGMLFVYNHDALFDSEMAYKTTELDAMTPQTVFVIGPKEVEWLYALVDSLTAEGPGEFLFPDLKLGPAYTSYSPVLPLESMVSPWIGLRRNKGFEVFVKGNCSVKNLTHLIDYLFTYQILREYPKISIWSIPGPQEEKDAFKDAVQIYARESGMEDLVSKRLAGLSFAHRKLILPPFIRYQIGMNGEQFALL